MFKLMDKKIIAILRKSFLLNWSYAKHILRINKFYIKPFQSAIPRGISSTTSLGYAIFVQPAGFSHTVLQTSGSTHATWSER